jgi:uncharacterized protein (TIGR00369 family)
MKPSDAPDGFEPLDLISGYSVAFGPVYLNRSERKLGFRVEKSHLNPFGLCHGGAMATFADLQVIAVKDGPGIKPGFSPTVSMSVDYLSPARLGDWVEATVTLAKATRSLIFTQALITANGETVARATALYRNIGLDGRAAAKMGQSTAQGAETTP